MNWTHGFSSRAAIEAAVTQSWSSPRSDGVCLKHRFVGYQSLWCLYEVRYAAAADEAERVVRFVALHRVKKFKDGWALSTSEDSAGMPEVNCPLAYLEGLTIDSESKRSWIGRVREFHARRGTGAKFEVGQIVPLKSGCTPQQVRIVRSAPLIGEFGGTRFKVKRSHIDLSRAPVPMVTRRPMRLMTHDDVGTPKQAALPILSAVECCAA